jgi:hypothetical protein
LLPRENNGHIVGYDPKNYEFYIYDINFKRVTRSFQVPNPLYNEEKVLQEELKEQSENQEVVENEASEQKK